MLYSLKTNTQQQIQKTFFQWMYLIFWKKFVRNLMHLHWEFLCMNWYIQLGEIFLRSSQTLSQIFYFWILWKIRIRLKMIRQYLRSDGEKILKNSKVLTIPRKNIFQNSERTSSNFFNFCIVWEISKYWNWSNKFWEMIRKKMIKKFQTKKILRGNIFDLLIHIPKTKEVPRNFLKYFKQF